MNISDTQNGQVFKFQIEAITTTNNYSNYSTWTTPHMHEARILGLDIFYAALALICFIFGILGNILSLTFYCKQKLDVSTLMYIMIIATDLITSLLMLAPGLSYFSEHKPMLFADSFICALWGMLWMVVSRISVFLVALLSISRALKLVCPFRFRLTKTFILIPTTIYTMAQILVACLPFMYGNKYIYDHVTVTCLWTIVDDIPPGSTGFTMIYLFCIIVPFVMPVCPVMISCMLSVREIRQSRYTYLLSKGGGGSKPFFWEDPF